MVFDTTVRHFKLFDGTNYVIVGQSAGIVKCFRAFPVFGNDMFKPLSKTKPLTTPLFGLSEVFWRYLLITSRKLSFDFAWINIFS